MLAAEPLPDEIANALPALIAYVGADHRYRFVNKAYEDWFGLTLADLRGRTVREVVGEERYKVVARHVETVLSGEPVAFEDFLSDRNGQRRRVEAKYVPRKDADGVVVGYYVLIVDRSESDRGARLIEDILDGLAEGFCSFDRDWRCTYCNQEAARNFRRPRGELIGRTYWEIFPSPISETFEGTIRAVMDGGPAVEIETDQAVPGAILAINIFPIEPGAAIRFRDVTARHARARLQQQQQQRLELAMGASGLGDWSWDATTDMVTLSERAAEIFAIAPGPVMTWTEMLELIHEEDRENARLSVEKAVAERTGYEVEYRVRRLAEGGWNWVLALGKAQYDEVGDPIGMLGVVGDISRSKAAEEALRESEARFRAMADSAPAPVWVTAVGGELEFVNQAFLDFAGRPAEALFGDGWISLIHPDDLPGVAARRAVARAGFEAYGFEARFRSADGSWKHIQANAQPRFDASGAFQGYVGLAVDMTEARNAERSLRESEQRFRLATEDAPVMLWMSDDVGRPIYFNRMLREFCGLPEDAMEYSGTATLHPEEKARVLPLLEDALARRVAFVVEARHVRADGAIRTLLTRGEPRFESDGRFVGLIGVHGDVTEARLAQAHQQLLINELNHRVKNTLATVQSIMHQTLRDGAVTRQARDQLTARLLALSAAHNVLTRENWEGAPFPQIAAEAVRPYEDAGGQRIIRSGPRVRLAPNIALALSMALHELATNALKYGALSVPEGRVALEWRLTEAGDRISIEWREENGPPASRPQRTGFGSRLLTQGLATELGAAASFDFAPSGLRCVIEAPIQAGGRRAAD